MEPIKFSLSTYPQCRTVNFRMEPLPAVSQRPLRFSFIPSFVIFLREKEGSRRIRWDKETFPFIVLFIPEILVSIQQTILFSLLSSLRLLSGLYKITSFLKLRVFFLIRSRIIILFADRIKLYVPSLLFFYPEERKTFYGHSGGFSDTYNKIF